MMSNNHRVAFPNSPALFISTGGERGVFEIEELVDLLQRENCRDICVLRVDPSLGYVDHMVVVTCTSARHIAGLAEFVNKVFKRKTGHVEGLRLEGRKSPMEGWIAVDMGE